MFESRVGVLCESTVALEALVGVLDSDRSDARLALLVDRLSLLDSQVLAESKDWKVLIEPYDLNVLAESRVRYVLAESRVRYVLAESLVRYEFLESRVR